jgi:hypothetical protein
MIAVGDAAAVARRHPAPHHGVTNALKPIQAPEHALCRGAAAGIAHIGNHEGHGIGDVPGAEQK